MSVSPKAKLGILLSGRGSNFLAIADHIAQGKLTGCEIAVVISNKADAPGLEAARSEGYGHRSARTQAC
jgi:phosphoribosylglycinamide formyltransferase 1